MNDFVKKRRQIWIGTQQFCRLERAALRHGMTRRQLADAILALDLDAIAKKIAAGPKEPRRRRS